MQKIRAKLRFCLTESITDNPGTLDTKNSKILKKKNIVHSSIRF